MEPIFEQWRTINGYTNCQISNTGNVMNITNAKFMKLRIGTTGSYHVG